MYLLWSITSPGPATTTVARTSTNSPARQAQIIKGDKILAINGKKMSTFTDVSIAIDESKGKQLDITLENNGKKRQVQLTPKKTADKSYQIGILAATNESFGVKLQRGWTTAVGTTGLIFNAVGNLFRHFSLNKLSGPVGIYSQTAQVSKMGLTYLLAFLAMISINLGIVNLIPIPGLDGGKLLLNLIELVRGKPISEEHEAIVELIGFALLLILIIAVTGNDIYRYFIK